MLELLIPRRRIQARVAGLARRLDDDYRGLSPLYLAVLKGSYVFLADLTRRLEEPPEVEFVRLSLYGRRGEEKAERVRVLHHPCADLSGRHILIVEDIVDSGRTLAFLLNYVRRRRPASVRACALLAREGVLEEMGLRVDYLGLTVGPGWLVGYGLDRGERWRTLPDIYRLRDEP